MSSFCEKSSCLQQQETRCGLLKKTPNQQNNLSCLYTNPQNFIWEGTICIQFQIDWFISSTTSLVLQRSELMATGYGLADCLLHGLGETTIFTTMSVRWSITPQEKGEVCYSMFCALLYDPGVCWITLMHPCLSSCGLGSILLDIMRVSRQVLQQKDCRIQIVSHSFKLNRTF